MLLLACNGFLRWGHKTDYIKCYKTFWFEAMSPLSSPRYGGRKRERTSNTKHQNTEHRCFLRGGVPVPGSMLDVRVGAASVAPSCWPPLPLLWTRAKMEIPTKVGATISGWA